MTSNKQGDLHLVHYEKSGKIRNKMLVSNYSDGIKEIRDHMITFPECYFTLERVIFNSKHSKYHGGAE